MSDDIDPTVAMTPAEKKRALRRAKLNKGGANRMALVMGEVKVDGFKKAEEEMTPLIVEEQQKIEQQILEQQNTDSNNVENGDSSVLNSEPSSIVVGDSIEVEENEHDLNRRIKVANPSNPPTDTSLSSKPSKPISPVSPNTSSTVLKSPNKSTPAPRVASSLPSQEETQRRVSYFTRKSNADLIEPFVRLGCLLTIAILTALYSFILTQATCIAGEPCLWIIDVIVYLMPLTIRYPLAAFLLSILVTDFSVYFMFKLYVGSLPAYSNVSSSGESGIDDAMIAALLPKGMDQFSDQLKPLMKYSHYLEYFSSLKTTLHRMYTGVSITLVTTTVVLSFFTLGSRFFQ